jgi:hypothetical protein
MLLKKLKLLIICLLLTFISLSQTVTNNGDSTVCFPVQTVRNIQKDLIRGDYCDSIDKAKDTIIIAQKEKIAAKDSTLKVKNEQLGLAKENSGLYKDVIKVREEEIKALVKASKKDKFWKTVYKIGDFVLPVVASYFTYRVLTK